MGDIVIALVVAAIAVVLGLTVHPLLFFLLVLVLVFLLARHRGRAAV